MNGPDFDRLYREHDDPFEVETSWYERRKQSVLLATLPRERYRRAWDAAAGTGALAAALAERADDVLATDSSPVAVERLIARGLDAEHNRLPHVPNRAHGADLIVLAEVLYYFDDADAEATLAAIAGSCAPGADLVAVNWLGDGDDLACPGPVATRRFDEWLAAAGWHPLVHLDDDRFALRCWRSP